MRHKAFPFLLKATLVWWVSTFGEGPSGLFAQAQKRIVYKQVDTLSLALEVFYPPDWEGKKAHPAMIFFHGGGWNSGSPSQFEEHAKHFSARGLVCFLAEYRLHNTHGATPFESLKDAKSAIRFLRDQASAFKIDTHRIIAAGGSAGGHLAAATGLIEDYNDPRDPEEISARPQALVLFNPVFDNGPGGYGYERVGEAYHSFSPLHNIQEGAPPTIVFLGTEDDLVPVFTAQYYKLVMEKVGSRCDLELYEGQQHGFFNYRNRAFYEITLQAADEFLVSLGYLEKEKPSKER